MATNDTDTTDTTDTTETSNDTGVGAQPDEAGSSAVEPASEAPDPGPAPARKRASRRPRKAAEAEADEPAPAAEGRRTTRKRAASSSSRSRTRKAAASPEEPSAVVAEDLEVEAQVEGPTQDPVLGEPARSAEQPGDEPPSAQETDAEETDAEETDAEDTSHPADSGPALPSFTVLFQPPDPAATQAAATRRRRRSAQAPQTTTGQPSRSTQGNDAGQDATDQDTRPEAPAADHAAVTEPASDDTTDDTSRDDTSSGEAASEDDETTPRRSRRRRGGKGRRGRSAGDPTDGQDGDGADSTSPEPEPGETRARRQSGPERARDDQSASAGDTEGSSDSDDSAEDDSDGSGDDDESSTSRRRRRRRRGGSGESAETEGVRVREPRTTRDEPTAVRGSTRLEAKKQRRREGREAGRRRTVITEAEFLARRESVDRVMVVRNKDGRTQMGVLEDGVLVEHYIDQATTVSMAGNIYLGRVQNVLPSMEAAFIDIGKSRNAVLYAGEVNWDAAGLEVNQPKRIENALSSGQTVLVQVTKDPIGHKGARLTAQISLPGRYLVYVPNSSMTGISRKLPDTERARLKKILREVVPDSAGVIVRTAAEGASEEELRADVERLSRTWQDIQAKAEAASGARAGKSKGRKKNGGGPSSSGSAPMLLQGEPDLTVRVIRDVFNEDFKQLVVSGEQAWNEIHPYITNVAPDLAPRVSKWTAEEDLFRHHRVDEQLAKAMDRKVWLPSGGSLVIDRTEAMTVVDVNTGKFVGSGGNLEETVTKNNIEAAEEIVRQLRLRDIGGIIVIDFIDMVLESNRELVVRRLLECLGRDRTKHQVAEVTSLGLVQMTRKRVGSGLIEVFSETCEHCNGRGFVIHSDPVDKGAGPQHPSDTGSRGRRGRRPDTSSGPSSASSPGKANGPDSADASGSADAPPRPNGPTAAQIAAAAHAAAVKAQALGDSQPVTGDGDTNAVAARAVLGFPDDIGPWGGTDEPTDAEREAAAAEHVELESDVSGEDDVATTSRGRRRRGRVVAAAGPPRASAPVLLSADGSAISEQEHAD